MEGKLQVAYSLRDINDTLTFGTIEEIIFPSGQRTVPCGIGRVSFRSATSKRAKRDPEKRRGFKAADAENVCKVEDRNPKTF